MTTFHVAESENGSLTLIKPGTDVQSAAFVEAAIKFGWTPIEVTEAEYRVIRFADCPHIDLMGTYRDIAAGDRNVDGDPEREYMED